MKGNLVSVLGRMLLPVTNFSVRQFLVIKSFEPVYTVAKIIAKRTDYGLGKCVDTVGWLANNLSL